MANPAVAAVCIDGETVAYDESTAALHHLDLPASAVWTRLDGRKTLGEVSAELAAETGAVPTRVATDVLALVERLVNDALVVIPHQRSGVVQSRDSRKP